MNESDSASSGAALAAGGAVRAEQADVYQVRLFGAFTVRAPDGALVTPSSRKARALLACLLLAPEQEMPRERLAALLWSQRGEEQARASLRQTLYELRGLTAGDKPLLRLDRTHVRLAADRIRTDLDLLRDAAQAGDAPALAAQVGDQPLPLLRDFDGIDPAFDEWLAVEQVQRHDERRQAVLGIGLAATATPAVAEALQRLAAALLAADPYDEAAARLAMEAAHRRGDRDGVRVVHLRLETALRLGLATSPSAETRRLRDELMRAPVAGPPPIPIPVPVEADAEADANPDPGRPALPPAPFDPASLALAWGEPARLPLPQRPAVVRPLVALALALLVGAAAWAGWRKLAPAPRTVLRVEALEAAATDPPAQALRIGLAAELARVMVGNDRSLVVADASTSSTAPARDRRTAGADSEAAILVTGQAQSSGGLLHASLRLVAADSGTILWSSSFTRAETEIEPLREQMATKLADVAVCAMGGRSPPLEALGADTMRLFLGACEQKHGDWALSAKLLRQVVALHPRFAHAWAMLAAATAVSATQFPDEAGAALRREAEDDAQHALALDPSDGEAYFGRSMAMAGLHRWAARQAVLEAGHTAEPDNPQVNSALASNLAAVGRGQEAIAYAQHAVEFDPFSPGKASELVQMLAFGGDVYDAVVLLREQRRRFPQSEWAARTELSVEAFVGDARRAGQLLAEAKGRVDLTAAREAMWRTWLAARQDPSAAHTEAAAGAVLANAAEPMQSRVAMAVRLAALGRADQAFGIADSVSASQAEQSDLKPLFWSIAAPLRADPRFMPLAARYGLAAIWLQTERWPDFCRDQSVAYDCRAEALKAVAAAAKTEALQTLR